MLCSFEGPRRAWSRPVSGGYGEGETPLPIPNRAVKPLSADGTWPARAWESRTPPVFYEHGSPGRHRRPGLVAWGVRDRRSRSLGAVGSRLAARGPPFRARGTPARCAVPGATPGGGTCTVAPDESGPRRGGASAAWSAADGGEDAAGKSAPLASCPAALGRRHAWPSRGAPAHARRRPARREAGRGSRPPARAPLPRVGSGRGGTCVREGTPAGGWNAGESSVESRRVAKDLEMRALPPSRDAREIAGGVVRARTGRRPGCSAPGAPAGIARGEAVALPFPMLAAAARRALLGAAGRTGGRGRRWACPARAGCAVRAR